MTTINQELINDIINDREVRQKITKNSFLFFFIVYFSHYIKYVLASYHEEIINIIQNKNNKLVCITAFRGSGKSTLVTMSATLWSILGSHRKNFVLIICQTKEQAKLHMSNLRVELETNNLLKSDLGPFTEDVDNEWRSASLVFSNTKARITIASFDQSIRGMRHREYRPDLIILDDIDDIQSVKTQESRDKTFDWFTSEIIPLGDLDTRIIVLGNILHEDSFIIRLKKKIENEYINGIYREYPLVDIFGKCLWPGKFPNQKILNEFKKTIINEISWKREYLLQLVPDEYQVIYKEWIHYYDKLPKNTDQYSSIIIAVDPAISEKEKADYSAIITGLVIYDGDHSKLYILPTMINDHLSFPDLIDRIEVLKTEMEKICPTTYIVVESVAFQTAITQLLERKGHSGSESIRITEDKRTRLSTISHRIKCGDILFPKNESEKLINQMTGFGIEKHDDLMDALSLCAYKFNTYPSNVSFRVTSLG